MTIDRIARIALKILDRCGMLSILLALCVYYSMMTWAEQYPAGAAGGPPLAADIAARVGGPARVLIVARDTPEDGEFVESLRDRLVESGSTVVQAVRGQPQDARRAIVAAIAAGEQIDVIAANQVTATWSVLENLPAKFPELANVQVMQPRSYRWPNFLKASNLLNIANQIAVIAMLAIGMTIVVITGGIDLSVGSLIALSAVIATYLIRDYAGAEQASALAMTACSLAAVALCAAVGAVSGVLIAHNQIPPFIATLSIMLVARGSALKLAKGESISQVPETFIWIGRGADFMGIPNAVVLMALLYFAAHIMMSRMPLGRYIYAVGGNREAARLSGVSVSRVLLFAYSVCGGLAGLGGIVLASQLKSGSPTYGMMYEMYVIAAVVVGGTSLSGGEGRIFGTLVGALIIAVIQNGMNLTDVESNTQMVVLGLVILGAVLLDRLKKHGLKMRVT